MRSNVFAAAPRLCDPGISRTWWACRFSLSQDISVPQKRAIARAAAELITAGESIIINGGTTTFALVEFLADH